MLILTGLAAGLAAFAAGEMLFQTFRPLLTPQELMGNRIMVATFETNTVAAAKNSALAFGALGAILGASLGGLGGYLGRSTRSSIMAAVLGLIVGAVVGAILPLALVKWSVESATYYFEYDLLISMALHCVIWGAIGGAAGLAFGAGMGTFRLMVRAVMAGGFGACLGSVTFELIGAACFPAAETGQPISATWLTRLLARLLVAIGASAAIAITLMHSPSKPKAYSASASTPVSEP
jgi:hypothetical protein